MIYKSNNMPVNESQQVNEFLLAALGCAAALALLGNGLSKVADTITKVKDSYKGLVDAFKGGNDKERNRDEKELKNLLKKKPEDLSPKEAKRIKELQRSVDSDALNSKERAALNAALGKSTDDDDSENNDNKNDKTGKENPEDEVKLAFENTGSVMALVQKKIKESGTPEEKAQFEKLSMCMFNKNGEPISPNEFQQNAEAVLGKDGLEKLAKESNETLGKSNISFDTAIEEANKLDPVECAQLITQAKANAVNAHHKAEADKAKKEHEAALKKIEDDHDKALAEANKLKNNERDAAIDAADKEYNDKKKAQEEVFNQRIDEIDNSRKEAVNNTMTKGAEFENNALEAKISEKKQAAGTDAEALSKVEEEAKKMRDDLKKQQGKAKTDAVDGVSVKLKPEPKKEGNKEDNKEDKKEDNKEDNNENNKEDKKEDNQTGDDNKNEFTDDDGTVYKKDGDNYTMTTKDGDSTEISQKEFETERSNVTKKKDDEKKDDSKTSDDKKTDNNKPADVKNPKTEWKKVPSKIKGGKPHFQNKSNPDSTMSLKDWNEKMNSYHKAKKRAEEWNKEHPDDQVKIESMEQDLYDMIIEVMDRPSTACSLVDFLKR